MASRKVGFNFTFTVTAIVIFGIAVLVNGVLGRVNLGRFDLTEDSLYTISPAAKRVLSQLRVPVQVKFYITSREDMPTSLQTLERDVVDKLAEFRVVSGGNLDFAVYDPSKDDELAERIASKGIRPFQVQSIERDAMGIKLVYSAIAVAYKEKDEEILPQILPQSLETLEYDICAAVTRLVRDMDPVVAVYGSKQALDPQLMQMYLQMGQEPPAPEDLFTNVVDLLRRENYDARRVEIAEESPIPEEAATLLVLAPRNLNERQRYEINRFVQQGGNVVFALQRYEFNYSPDRRGGFNISASQQDSGLDDFLSAYGVGISDRILMDANMEVLSIPSERNLGGLRLQVAEPVQAPIQIKVSTGQFNEDVSITNKISELLYLWGSRLVVNEEKLAENEVEITTLLTTSDQAWEADYTPGPLGGPQFLPDPDSDVSHAPLAVLFSGVMPNQFADGTVPPWNSAESDSVEPPPVETFTPLATKVVVVGCSKMFDNNIIGAGNNSLFLLNAVDALTLGEDLIQIRAKAFSQRLLEPVSDRAKLLYRMFAIGLVPALVAAFGIFRMMRRRQEQAMFLAAQRS